MQLLEISLNSPTLHPINLDGFIIRIIKTEPSHSIPSHLYGPADLSSALHRCPTSSLSTNMRSQFGSALLFSATKKPIGRAEMSHLVLAQLP